jgi:proton-dependent oligopeptide transporter, POT family
MPSASDFMTASPSHPRGIYTLFLTEMWERMSFYGIKVLLVLFMVDQTRGGKGYRDEEALAIFGLYTALVYITALPGGWIGDRLLGAKRAVWWGGVAIAIGHLLLGMEQDAAFYSGLIIISFGSGLLKPNLSVMVAGLYPEGGARRDAGFTLLYMGINLGSFIGQILCSNLGEHYGWRWGFSAAAAGMMLGLVQYQVSRKHLAGVGEWKPLAGQNVSRDWALLLGSLALVAVGCALCFTRIIPFDAILVSRWTSVAIVAMAVLFYLWTFTSAGLNTEEKSRMWVTIILFLSAVMFFAGFAQGSSSLVLFAERFTIRQFGEWKLAAGMFQALNPVMVLLLSPLLVMLWSALARRRAEPLLATKFSVGLLFLAASFVLASWAAMRALDSGPVWPLWLVGMYLLMTLGELFLSPVGLSAVTKLAPERLASRMMGVWFLAISLGYLLAGLVAGSVSGAASDQMPQRFMLMALSMGAAGLLLLALAKRIQRLIPGVR